MKSSGFIPVDKRQKEFYVILDKNRISNKSKVAEIVNNEFPDLAIQFFIIDNRDFGEVLNYVEGIIKSNDVDNKPSVPVQELEPSPEEMLVSIGWLTSEQLKECIEISNAKQVPIDAVFHEKEYLSYERIVSYLKKKYGLWLRNLIGFRC